MKKITLTPARALALMALSMFILLWAVWYFGYRHFLIWLEGFSYFSTLPDFMAAHKEMPYGLLAYVGSFLHQFYANPAVGAAIQAFMATWVVICTGTALICLLKSPERALWISLIPVPFFIGLQFWDFRMLNSVLWFLIFAGILLAAVAVSLTVRRKWDLPEIFSKGFMNPLVLAVVSVVTVYMLVFMDPRNRVHEEQVRLQHLGETHQWEEILNTVSTADAKSDDLKMRYVLLALSEKGMLADHAFSYGLGNSDDFIFYENINPLCLHYNALFYQCSGMHNAAIHQLYQQGVQSSFGVSFSTLRRLADIYIELKDYELARKYVDILSHSTCHGKWVKERLPQLEAIRNAEPEYVADERNATISNFIHTAVAMARMYPENRKYADLMLCSLLADGDIQGFVRCFDEVAKIHYPSGSGIPDVYKDAMELATIVGQANQ